MNVAFGPDPATVGKESRCAPRMRVCHWCAAAAASSSTPGCPTAACGERGSAREVWGKGLPERCDASHGGGGAQGVQRCGREEEGPGSAHRGGDSGGAGCGRGAHEGDLRRGFHPAEDGGDATNGCGDGAALAVGAADIRGKASAPRTHRDGRDARR